MKKTLEAELMSLAHRILQLKNRADIHELKAVTGVLYEKLTVLSFTEKHFAGAQPTIGKKQVEEALEEHQETKTAVEHTISSEEKPNEAEQAEVTTQSNELHEVSKHISGATSEPGTEKAEDITEDTPSVPEPIDDVVEETSSNPQPIDEAIEETPFERKPKDDDDIRNIGVHYDDLPQFEPVPRHQPTAPAPAESKNTEPEAPAEPETPEIPKEKESVDLFSQPEKKEPSTRNNVNPHKASLNDRLKHGITIGLNDRLAYIKHLFDGNAADYNRVLSQLNTIDSSDEAHRFIEQVVKPDYNRWEGKEVYENKFLKVIENKFD